MKYLFLFLIVSLSNDLVLSKPTTIQYNHTRYYYNYTNCGNTPYLIENSINSTDCNSITNNMCLNFTDTIGIFNTCDPIINKSSDSGFVIIITLLILLLCFMVYKVFCQNVADNLCICIRDSIYDCICPTERKTYQPNYSSL